MNVATLKLYTTKEKIVHILMYGIGVFFIPAGLVRRKRPRPLTYMASIFQGLFTDLWKIILADVQGVGWIDGLLIFLLGLVVIAIAAAPYFLSFFPPNPGDDLTQAISERGMRFMFAKILFEVSTAVVAFFLHGEINVGTVILIVLLGPLIDIFIVLTKKILNRGKIRYGLQA